MLVYTEDFSGMEEFNPKEVKCTIKMEKDRAVDLVHYLIRAKDSGVPTPNSGIVEDIIDIGIQGDNNLRTDIPDGICLTEKVRDILLEMEKKGFAIFEVSLNHKMSELCKIANFNGYKIFHGDKFCGLNDLNDLNGDFYELGQYLIMNPEPMR